MLTAFATQMTEYVILLNKKNEIGEIGKWNRLHLIQNHFNLHLHHHHEWIQNQCTDSMMKLVKSKLKKNEFIKSLSTEHRTLSSLWLQNSHNSPHFIFDFGSWNVFFVVARWLFVVGRRAYKNTYSNKPLFEITWCEKYNAAAVKMA